MKLHILPLLVMLPFVFNTVALIFFTEKKANKQWNVLLVNHRKINLGISGLSIRKSKFSSADSATLWTAACQASLSITNSQSLLKLMSTELMMSFNHLVFCWPLLLAPSIFPKSGSFPVSQFFTSGGQSIGASASASDFPMNIQD